MWPYWLIFLIPAYAATQESARSTHVISAESSFPLPWSWRLAMISITMLVGFRHEVGGDWFEYLAHFKWTAYESRFTSWWLNDPGYRFLLWLGVQADWSVHSVNLMGGAFFTYGLVSFSRNLPRPWLALAVSAPYIIIVLGMGYSRQGFALGCVMAGLVALQQEKTVKFFIWVIVGATFHKSALIILPIVAMVNSKRRVLTLIWLAVIGVSAYALLLAESVESLQSAYIDAAMQSQGALIRLIMNAVPAVLFLVFRDRFKLNPEKKQLWFWLSFFSIILFIAYFASPSSTAVDRIALYALPIQMMVFSYLPEVLGRDVAQRNHYVAIILLYYATVEFVWLNYATHAHAWLPYRFYPFE